MGYRNFDMWRGSQGTFNFNYVVQTISYMLKGVKKKTKRFAFQCITFLFLNRFLPYAHQIKRLVLTILTSIITFFQCKYFKRYRRRKNTCGSFFPAPNIHFEKKEKHGKWLADTQLASWAQISICCAIKINIFFLRRYLLKYLHQKNVIIILVRIVRTRRLI